MKKWIILGGGLLTVSLLFLQKNNENPSQNQIELAQKSPIEKQEKLQDKNQSQTKPMAKKENVKLQIGTIEVAKTSFPNISSSEQRALQFVKMNSGILREFPVDVEIRPGKRVKTKHTIGQEVIVEHEGIPVRGNIVTLENMNEEIVGLNKNINPFNKFETCQKRGKDEALKTLRKVYSSAKIISGPELQYLPGSGMKAYLVYSYVLESKNQHKHDTPGEHLPQSEVLVSACSDKIAKYAFF